MALWPVRGAAATDTSVTLWIDSGYQQLAQPLTFAAMVGPISPNWPGGTVDFLNGASPIDGCTGRTLQQVWTNNGPEPIAYCTTSFPQLGPVTVRARYNGDTKTGASTATVAVNIDKAFPWPYIASNPAVPVSTTLPFGQAVILGATFTPAAGLAPPTGTVTFSDGGAVIGTQTIGADGHAGIVIPTMAVGGHSIAASYSGDANYQATITNALSIPVVKASVMLLLSTTAFQTGQPVTLYVTPLTVSPGMATPTGTIDFSASGAPIAGCTRVALVNGMARCPAVLSQAVVTLSYSGDANTDAISMPRQLVPGKALSGMYLSSASTAAVLGATVTIEAHVTGVPDLPSPTGTVVFSDGGATVTTVSLSGGGRASFSAPSGGIPALGVGAHLIRAVYNGDSTYQSITSMDLPVAVGKAPTTLTMAATAAQAGAPVTLRAAVTVVSPASATPTGQVTFTDGTNTGSCTLAQQSGTAQCSATIGNLASYEVSAHYEGDQTSGPSSQVLQLPPGKAVAGIYTFPSLATPPFGTPVSVTAVLVGAAGAAAPGGSVSFSDGGSAVGTVPVGADGRASITLDSPAVGDHEIAAVYGGDTNYQGATAPALSVVVSKAVTRLDLASTPAQAGQTVVLKAAVTILGPGTAAQGAVDFSNGATAIPGCSGVALVNGVAECSTSLALGTYTIAASYSGGPNTAGATASLQVTVGKLTPGFYVAAYSTALPYGAGAGVNGLLMGNPMPTGTVRFTEGTTTLATVTAAADGSAPLRTPWGSLPPLAIGSHSIVAAYSGDSNYQGATAPAVNITISKAATSIALAWTPAQINQPVTLKAAVVVASPGVATPAGTVDFTIGGIAIPGCKAMTLQTGAASCTTTLAQVGTYNVGAQYSGDAYTNSSSAAMPLTAGKAAAGLYIACTPAQPVFGAAVTVGALLLGASGMTPPGGTVTFSEGPAILGTAAVGTDGHALVSIPAGVLTTGLHTFTAAYAGDGNYGGGSTASLVVAVGKAATNTILTTADGAMTAIVSVVAPGTGTPTGTVQFYAGGVPVGTANLAPRNGQFAATVPASSAVSSVWAVYQGDANFASSASTSGGAQAGAVTLSADPASPIAGQPFTISVAVAAAAGTAAGKVELVIDGASFGTTALASGAAVFAVPANVLAAGSHTVQANYSGDAANPAASGTMTVVVAKAAANITITASAPAAVYGQPVTFTAQVTGQGSAVVQFADGTVPMGSAPVASGIATLTVSNLPVGAHSVSASWAGDATPGGATSAPVAVTVSKAQTTTMLVSSGALLVATVAAKPPGGGTPGGSIRLADASSGSVLTTTALAGGSAQIAQAGTSDTVIAVYPGDANFEGSTSAPLMPLAAVNAASFSADAFASDEIVTLFGPQLAAASMPAVGAAAAAPGGPTVAITDSAGVRRGANLLFVSRSQVSIVMPAETAAGPAVIAVTNAAGLTLTTSITVAKAAPGLFAADGSGNGQAAGQTIRVHGDGSQDTPADLSAGPVDLGGAADTVYLVLYGTGIRHGKATAVKFASGLCTGGDVTPLFAGAQPEITGLDQVNVAIPQCVRGAGAVPVVLTVDGAASNALTVAFR